MKITKNLRFCILSALFLLLVLSLFAQDYPKASQEYDISFYSCPRDISPLPLSSRKKVKNIIFMIGDGMGVAHVDSARIKACGANGRLHMERMPVTGLLKTHSHTHLVTDSAAAGTALAAGIKTFNGAISLNPDKKPFLTILEASRNIGKSTGLAVTCAITHATPAVFASHAPSRNDQSDIAPQLLENKVNVLLGGGKEFFIPKSQEGSKRKDERNLISEAKKAGYEVVETKDQMNRVSGNHVMGLFQMGHLKTVDPEPSLAEMTLKALDILSKNKKGFFLMVEGSQIDWAGHANNPEYAIRETLLFDEAVYVALNFAQKSGDTLVVVTADHETGGMSVVEGSLTGEDMKFGWTSKNHSAVQVPVYAFGPRASLFTGVIDNVQVPRKFAEIFKISDFPKIIP
ncbi:alkaline phosphatase [Candidatus Sumerlaeota bacterium]|nr:alkaline phosphatase [Candidatus Sumerlaeota bacterium]